MPTTSTQPCLLRLGGGERLVRRGDRAPAQGVEGWVKLPIRWAVKPNSPTDSVARTGRDFGGGTPLAVKHSVKPAVALSDITTILSSPGREEELNGSPLPATTRWPSLPRRPDLNIGLFADLWVSGLFLRS